MFLCYPKTLKSIIRIIPHNRLYQTYSGTHLKAKNIKYSNGSFLFTTVHNTINSAYKPSKHVRVDFFSQSIPTNKTTIYCLLSQHIDKYNISKQSCRFLKTLQLLRIIIH